MFAVPALAESSRLRYFTFFYLYLMQGIPSGFALTALANYLTGRGVSTTAVGSFVSFIGIPWIVQLLWGPLIDRYRYSVVGHYKHWIVLTQAAAGGASLLLLLVSDPVVQIWTLAGLFFGHALVASIQDASVDALAILVTPERERGRVNACMRGGLLLGISFGAAILSTVLHRYGFRVAAGLQSGVLVFFSLLFFLTRLHPTDPLLPIFARPRSVASPIRESQSSKPQLAQLFRQLGHALISQPSRRIFGIIWLCYLCFGLFIRSLSFFLIRDQRWQDQEVSVLTGGWGSLVTLTVMLAGGYLADWLGPRRLQTQVLLILALFLVAFNALLITEPPRSLITAGVLFWGIADPLYSLTAFPILMALCRKDIAGSQFTAYMAMINLADIGGSYASGWLLESLPGPVLGLVMGIGLLILYGVLLRTREGVR